MRPNPVKHYVYCVDFKVADVKLPNPKSTEILERLPFLLDHKLKQVHPSEFVSP